MDLISSNKLLIESVVKQGICYKEEFCFFFLADFQNLEICVYSNTFSKHYVHFLGTNLIFLRFNLTTKRPRLTHEGEGMGMVAGSPKTSRA